MRIGPAARLALLAVLLVPGVAPATPTRPNVVLVITDDQDWHVMLTRPRSASPGLGSAGAAGPALAAPADCRGGGRCFSKRYGTVSSYDSRTGSAGSSSRSASASASRSASARAASGPAS